MHFELSKLIRPHLRELPSMKPHRKASNNTFKALMDANENAYGSPLLKWYNRYPEPYQAGLRQKIASIKNVKPEHILLGNGTDECIDLLIRAFCEPAIDHLIVFPPAYERYEAYAAINHVNVRQVFLASNFQLDLAALEDAIDAHTRILFFCSPNNPTGNALHRDDIEMVLNNFDGIVVIDEAYINYSRQRSFLTQLDDYPNLVVLQTFSQAWGLAGLRTGMLFASDEIIHLLQKLQSPYSVNDAAADLLSKALARLEDVNEMIRQSVKERQMLGEHLSKLDIVEKVYPSDANFIMVKMRQSEAIHQYLHAQGIMVQNLQERKGCENCLRITVGRPEQNQILLDALQKWKT